MISFCLSCVKISFGFAAFVILLTSQATAYASGSCAALTYRLSDDKNYYIFTATAVTDTSSAIAGYGFDFGDRQSYTFQFVPGSILDRSHAVSTHTYEKAGDYQVKASVVSMIDGKITTQSSPSCMVHIVIDSNQGQLVNTGPPNPLKLFVATFLVAVAAYYLWCLRRYGGPTALM